MKIIFIHFRNDLAPDEYESMKEDTIDQIKEFTVTLDRMNKGDITLNNSFSTMRAVRKINLLLRQSKLKHTFCFF